MEGLADSDSEEDLPKLGKRGRSQGKTQGKSGVSVSYEYEFEEEPAVGHKNKSVEKVSSSKRRASSKSTKASGSVDF